MGLNSLSDGHLAHVFWGVPSVTDASGVDLLIPGEG